VEAAVAAVPGIATSALATLVVVNGALLHPTAMIAMIATTFLHLAATTGNATTATAIVGTAAIAIATETSIGIRIGAAKRNWGADTRRARMRRLGRGRGGIPAARVGAVVRTKHRVGSTRAMRMIIIPGEGGHWVDFSLLPELGRCLSWVFSLLLRCGSGCLFGWLGWFRVWMVGMECGGELRYHFLLLSLLLSTLGECGMYDGEKMRREKTDELA